MGSYRGALSGVRPDDLAAHTIGAVVERTGVDPERVGYQPTRSASLPP